MINNEPSRDYIPHYNLEKPSWELAINTLSELMNRSEAEGLLRSICEENKLTSRTTELDTLIKIFRHLSRISGKESVAGKSLVVRSLTYKLLMATATQ